MLGMKRKRHQSVAKLFILALIVATGTACLFAQSDEMVVTLPGNVPLKLTRIPAGKFMMGSPTSERQRQFDEGPVHEVTLTKDYYLGVYEVTQEQWAAVMGAPMPDSCGDYGIGPEYPVYCVSVDDILGPNGFIERLNELVGTASFRLPTEAEWERAARAGTSTRFSHGDVLQCDDFDTSCAEHDKYMWWGGNDTTRKSKPVGLKLPNPYGLYDIHGNVFEFVSDYCCEPFPSEAVVDPIGPDTGMTRVARGGYWDWGAWTCRSANRESGLHRDRFIGLRIARNAETECSGPVIVAQPISAWIPPGHSVTLSVDAVASDGTLRYQWHLGQSGDVSSPIEKAEAAVITVAPDFTTSYWVRISDDCTSTLSTDSETATITVSSAPASVALASPPEPIIQIEGGQVGMTSFFLLNIGSVASQIVISQTRDDFSLNPSSFEIPPGGTQLIHVTASRNLAGSYHGAAIPNGEGIPAGLSIPIDILIASPPKGVPVIEAVAHRIDVVEPAGIDPVGVVRLRNVGDGPATGIMSSDSLWIRPQDGLIEIDSGGVVEVPFTISRSMRPDGDAAGGSAKGLLSFTYLSISSSGSTQAEIRRAFSTIVDTVKPEGQLAEIPPLEEGELAFFVPGVGHIVGSVGLFLSDLSFTTDPSGGLASDLSIYYTPIGPEGKSARFDMSLPSSPVDIADIVNSVYGESAGIGTLQIRGADVDSLRVVANILNVSHPSGTFGTTIPVIRSDRGIGPGEELVLTGLLKTHSGHTNLFIQEIRGGVVNVETEFFDKAGDLISTRSDILGPFRLTGLFDSTATPVLPEGAVTAVMRAGFNSTGRLAAYATPVDRASGDFWSVVDWSSHHDYSRTGPVIIPVAGSVLGANNTFFRTDLAVANAAGVGAAAMVTYFPRGESSVSEQLALQPREAAILDDVVTSFLGLPLGSVGHITVTPSDGELSLTSRTYTTVLGENATFGTGVPTLDLKTALRKDETRSLGGVEDSAKTSIERKVPQTFRSNLALIETAGASATVRVSLGFDYASGTSRGVATRDFLLQPNEFLLLQSVSASIMGDVRQYFGDLNNLQVDTEVIDGDGSVVTWVSSVDNGSGDSILRTE